ncbi:MAG: hypothetical protein ACRCTZ_15095 [Sarcina sp.]
MNEIISMIESVGFPIVCCFILFKQNNKLTDTLNNISVTMATLKEEIEDIKKKMEKAISKGDEK